MFYPVLSSPQCPNRVKKIRKGFFSPGFGGLAMVLAIACALASAALYQSPSPEVAGGGPAVDGISTDGGRATLPATATAELGLFASPGSETGVFKVFHGDSRPELAVSFSTNGTATEMRHFGNH